MSDDSDEITPEFLSIVFRLDLAEIHHLLDSGQMPGRRENGQWTFENADLREWIRWNGRRQTRTWASTKDE